jgi:hypothetical protein
MEYIPVWYGVIPFLNLFGLRDSSDIFEHLVDITKDSFEHLVDITDFRSFPHSLGAS